MNAKIQNLVHIHLGLLDFFVVVELNLLSVGKVQLYF